MVYMVTYQQNTFRLQILCLKFDKFYIFKIFEPQNAVRIKLKILQKFTYFSINKILFQEILCFFLYNENKSISFI